MDRRSAKFKMVLTLFMGILIGLMLTSTPAMSHVAGWLHNWTQHIRPRADQRYLRVSTTLKPGQSLTGVYSAWGSPSGYMGTDINYRIPLAQALPAEDVHFIAEGVPTTAECPSVGHAAQGHL